jgi:hypothetical protein
VAQHTREAAGVDGTQQTVKTTAVLRELCEVLVDHLECRFEHGVEHRRYLRSEDALETEE